MVNGYYLIILNAAMQIFLLEGSTSRNGRVEPLQKKRETQTEEDRDSGGKTKKLIISKSLLSQTPDTMSRSKCMKRFDQHGSKAHRVVKLSKKNKQVKISVLL